MAKPTGTAPKVEQHEHKAAPIPQAKPVKGQHAPVEGMCAGQGCKAKAHRFSFCDEHYDQFKFGLINKHGVLVPDYEKKWEHYHAYKARASKKVA